MDFEKLDDEQELDVVQEEFVKMNLQESDDRQPVFREMFSDEFDEEYYSTMLDSMMEEYGNYAEKYIFSEVSSGGGVQKAAALDDTDSEPDDGSFVTVPIYYSGVEDAVTEAVSAYNKRYSKLPCLKLETITTAKLMLGQGTGYQVTFNATAGGLTHTYEAYVWDYAMQEGSCKPLLDTMVVISLERLHFKDDDKGNFEVEVLWRDDVDDESEFVDDVLMRSKQSKVDLEAFYMECVGEMTENYDDKAENDMFDSKSDE